MSQVSDVSLANQGFSAFRTELNNILAAFNTQHAGTSAPASLAAGSMWLDTSGGATSHVLKFYDGSDHITFATINTTANTVDFSDSSITIADDSVTLAKMASGTDGNLITYDASGNPAYVATGSAGQVLTSAGAGQPPSFQTASGGTALTGSTNNTITTVTGADAIQGEAKLTFDGSTLINAQDAGAASEIKSSAGSVYTKVIADDASGFSAIDYSHDLRFKDAGTEKMRIDSNGNLKLEGGNPSIIHNNTTSGGDSGIKFQGGGTDYGFVNLDNSDGALDLGTSVNWSVRLFSNNAETFNQNTSTTKFNYAGTHDVRSYGWVGGGTGQGWKLQRDSNQGSMLIETHLTSARTMFSVINGNGTVGTISVNGSATSYNTSSDYRLKENEVAISDGIERLKQLKPYRFNFKADANKTVDGFFAHEVSSVVPEAISGDKDAMHPEVLYNDAVLYTENILYTADDELPEGKEIGDIKYAIGDVKIPADELPEGKNFGDVKEATKINPQAIDQSKLVPLLTSALQEAITKIENLEARVTALENA
jgi:hypothetical protein